MNRLISTNLENVAADRLPIADGSSPQDRPVRALFIHGNILGFKSVARALKHHCAGRLDIDAVHIDLVAPMWLKVLGKAAPFPTRGWDMHSTRYLYAWKMILGGWFNGPLDIRRFDVAHLMTQGNALAFIPFSKSTRTKFAVNLDGTAVQDCTEFGFSRIARAPFIAAERRMFSAADLLVTRNAWAATSLRSDFKVPESRIHVAQNSLAVPEAHRWDGRGREHGGLPRIAFVGTWVRKNGPLALRVHQRFLRDKAELHIFSDKRSGAELRNVKWRGYIPREELINEALPSMDIFLLPSREDMLPWAALEGAGAGLPIVASRVGAMGEPVRDGQTGILCEPGDDESFRAALERLVADAPLREKMGRAGREHVAQNHNPDVTYPKLIDRLIALARS
ncbi:MAG: glycosyltransferase family 4 protein [Phycisphaerales bacterium]|nr:glycosyltransferase family 4 protein [Phycisphaerales bacterium]